MKALLFSLLLLTGANFMIAQSSLTITSDNEKIRFVVIIDDQQLHDFFETRVEIDNIPAGYHYVRVVFEGDSIADYYKNILCTKDVKKIYKVVERSDVSKDLHEGGRDAGETLKIGEHDSTFNYLRDIYTLEQADKAKCTSTGGELIVNTDNSLSTSVLPFSKQKK